MSQSTSVNKLHKEHGTTRSYIVGFVLSLIFTALPYYLVVNKVLVGNTLLTAIVSVAILQMCIQIFFFLHLGRGPKPMYNVVFFVATVIAIIVVVAGSIFIMNNLYANMSPSDVTTRLAQDEGIAQVGGQKTGACQEIYTNHQVTIQNGVVTPSHIDAQECDSLTFISQDDTPRVITFGTYPQEQPYGGQTRINVRKNYPKTITLNQTGIFSFHDLINPETAGDFIVAPQ